MSTSKFDREKRQSDSTELVEVLLRAFRSGTSQHKLALRYGVDQEAGK